MVVGVVSDGGVDFRYSCEQGDNMKGYGWEEYDVRTGGKQVIRDVENKVDIITEFVKVEGGENGVSLTFTTNPQLSADRSSRWPLGRPH